MDTTPADNLLAMAREGDVEAFARLFEALRPFALAVAARLVGPVDAEDVVMDAYLKAWSALPRFTGRASLKTWLYRIVWNCAADLIRHRNRLREVPLPDPGAPEAPAISLQTAPPTPAAHAEGNDLAARVREQVARLPESQRTTLLLRFADGLSYKEIAAATGVSIGTVMSRLFNARRRLRRLLDRDERAKPADDEEAGR